jgi:hypothetical protein
MEATAFDYFMRDVLRLIFSAPGVLCMGMAISLRAWRRAMAAEDYGVEAWAIDRGLKGHAYVSRQLAGEKPIALEHTEVAPLAVRRWYHLFCLEELGLPPVTQTAAEVLGRFQRTA